MKALDKFIAAIEVHYHGPANRVRICREDLARILAERLPTPSEIAAACCGFWRNRNAEDGGHGLGCLEAIQTAKRVGICR